MFADTRCPLRGKEITMTHAAPAELFSPAFEANPYPTYAALRREGPVRPVAVSADTVLWLVTRYADVRRALDDPRLSKSQMAPESLYGDLIPQHVVEATVQHMLAADPPRHTRLRRLASTAFTASRVAALRPRVTEMADELLDAMATRDRVDLVKDFAYPLPMRVICELLGVPQAEQDSFRAWSNVIISGVAVYEKLPAAMASMLEYVRDLIRRKRSEPADDLLSAMIAARDGGDRLTENELSSTVFLLLIAGHETTVNLIGNGAYLLLSEPARWQRLRAEPELLPAAVEEFLRYESPVETASLRVATEELEIGGHSIPAGASVLLSLASANRDEERFADPGAFELTRGDSGHLAFGHGPHYCLGAALARLEAQVAFSRLLSRYPEARLGIPADNLEWLPGFLVRGLAQLPVTLT
jgi:cytochrome P450